MPLAGAHFDSASKYDSMIYLLKSNSIGSLATNSAARITRCFNAGPFHLACIKQQ